MLSGLVTLLQFNPHRHGSTVVVVVASRKRERMVSLVAETMEKTELFVSFLVYQSCVVSISYFT